MYVYQLCGVYSNTDTEMGHPKIRAIFKNHF